MAQGAGKARGVGTGGKKGQSAGSQRKKAGATRKGKMDIAPKDRAGIAAKMQNKVSLGGTGGRQCQCQCQCQCPVWKRSRSGIGDPSRLLEGGAGRGWDDGEVAGSSWRRPLAVYAH